MKTSKLTSDQAFFYEHAGWSYDPETETSEQGKVRVAKLLAKAEQLAKKRLVHFDWTIDREADSSDFSEEQPAWDLWICTLHHEKGTKLNTMSLCGIDFGRNGTPWGNPYMRVVEAEMAYEYLG